MSNRFPGSGFNLRMCYADAEKAPLPFLRQFAFAVYTRVNDLPYLDFVGQQVRDVVDDLTPLLRQAPSCANTREIENIALKVWERIRSFVEAERTT